MKVNIAKQVDTSILEKAIKDWQLTTLIAYTTTYIFMSKDTLNAISHDFSGLYFCKDIHDNKIPSNEMIAMYYGNKIYINNDLSFGEVEIR